MSITYFAYGSNMSPEVMAEKSPDHVFLGPARLDDHRLAFTRRSVRTGTGVADVVPTPGTSVWGALYRIDEQALASLDKKEGNGWAYTRTPLVVRLGRDSSEHEALTYTVVHKEPVEVPPSEAYLESLIRAGRERGLPDPYIRQLERLRSTFAMGPPAG